MQRTGYDSISLVLTFYHDFLGAVMDTSITFSLGGGIFLRLRDGDLVYDIYGMADGLMEDGGGNIDEWSFYGYAMNNWARSLACSFPPSYIHSCIHSSFPTHRLLTGGF